LVVVPNCGIMIIIITKAGYKFYKQHHMMIHALILLAEPNEGR
jgi:hypothetical protein